MSDSVWKRLANWRKESEGGDPWSTDYFAPPGGTPSSPYTHRQYKRPVPDIDAMFSVQKDLIRALNEFDNDDPDAARTAIENGYKVLQRFLQHYG